MSGDNRPIGVFDSGLGGLTGVVELRRVLPNENIIYFGDTGRVPYGTRSNDTIVKYTKQDIRFLRSFDVKALLCACGTASSVALPVIEPVPEVIICGVIDGAAAKAVAITKNGRIGIIGTPATIKSGSYEKAIKKLRGCEVFSMAAPLLVPLVENGRFMPGDPLAQTALLEYLTPLLKNGIDTLIMGCTHYPLMEEIIRNICGTEVCLVNAGKEAARIIAAQLKDKDLLCTEHCGKTEFFVSDDPVDFAKNSQLFMGSELSGTAKQIDIERY